MLRDLIFAFFMIAGVVVVAQDQLVEGSGEEQIVEGSGEEEDRSDCPSIVDMVLLLDSSGSQKNIFAENLDWAHTIVNNMPVDKAQVRVSVIQYAGYPFTEFALNTYPTKDNILDHINGASFRSGVTRTGAALRRAQIELFRENRGARDHARKVIVVFSDGLSIDDPQLVAAELRQLGVEVFVAAAAPEPYMDEILGIVGGSPNRIFARASLEEGTSLDEEWANHYTHLKWSLAEELRMFAEENTVCPWDSPSRLSENPAWQAHYEHVKLSSNEIFSQSEDERSDAVEMYDLTENADERRRTGPIRVTFVDEDVVDDVDGDGELKEKSKEIDVREIEQLETIAPTAASTRRPTTRRASTTIRARALNPDACPLDLLVVLDGSGSVQAEYTHQKAFVENLLNELEMPEQRGAVIQFAGERLQKTEFGFEKYSTHESLMKGFATKVRHFTGSTHLGKAIDHARKVLETRRRNTPTFVVVVSDGYTQDDVITPIEKLRRQHSDVEIFTVGLADLNNVVVLEQVAGDLSHMFIGQSEAARLQRRLVSMMGDC